MAIDKEKIPRIQTAIYEKLEPYINAGFSLNLHQEAELVQIIADAIAAEVDVMNIDDIHRAIRLGTSLGWSAALRMK